MRKRILFFTAALLALVLGVGLTACGGIAEDPKNYISNLENTGMFSNDSATQIRQTAVHDMIMDHFNAPLADGKDKKRAIFLGYDGYRTDALPNVSERTESAVMKTRADGGLYLAYAGGEPEGEFQATSTAPGWASLLTGGWANYHGVNNNGFTKHLSAKTVLTEVAEIEGKDYTSSFTTSWREHQSTTYSKDIEYAAAKNLPVSYYHGVDDMDVYYNVLKNIMSGTDMIFLTLEHTDHAGHSDGFGNPDSYKDASIEIDRLGYNLLTAIEGKLKGAENEVRAAEYEKEDWLIVISTDHGGTKKSHGGKSVMERSTWFAVNKTSINGKLISDYKDNTPLQPKVIIS